MTRPGVSYIWAKATANMTKGRVMNRSFLLSTLSLVLVSPLSADKLQPASGYRLTR